MRSFTFGFVILASCGLGCGNDGGDATPAPTSGAGAAPASSGAGAAAPVSGTSAPAGTGAAGGAAGASGAPAGGVPAAGAGADADAGAGDVDDVCPVTPPTSCAQPVPHFADVKPIFAKHCVSCHGGVPGLWPLDEYSHVADWFSDIRAAMIGCTMPPPNVPKTITTAERLVILNWIRCDFPE